MPGPPFDEYAERHTPVILNINGSPFHRGKADERLEICGERALETGAWIVYVNAVGGQDELVFDGGSVVVRPDGTLAHHAAMFEEDLLVVDIDGEISSAKERAALARGPRAGLPRVSCSGCATTCARTGSSRSCSDCRAGSTRRSSRSSRGTRSAPGASVRSRCRRPTRRPRASKTPGRWPAGSASGSTSSRSRGVFSGYLDVLQEPFRGTKAGIAEENLQARIRGNLLMALSNKFGSLVLATGNKSEYAVGYATLYGDMAGGFAPIKDVPKTLVYELAAWRNAIGASRDPADPAAGARQAAVGRAASGPEGHRLAPAVRGPRPDRRGVRRGRPIARGHHRRPRPGPEARRPCRRA